MRIDERAPLFGVLLRGIGPKSIADPVARWNERQAGTVDRAKGIFAIQAGHDTQTEPHERTTISGRDARQGEIVLRTRPRRIVFIAGLVGIILLIFVVSAIAYW